MVRDISEYTLWHIYMALENHHGCWVKLWCFFILTMLNYQRKPLKIKHGRVDWGMTIYVVIMGTENPSWIDDIPLYMEVCSWENHQMVNHKN